MLTPVDTLQTIITASVKKSTSSARRLLILGFLAGLFIAFAALASTIASMNLLKSPDTFGIGKLIQGLVFSGGLICVVLTGSELFTGNSLMFVGFLSGDVKIRGLLKNWGIVLIGNLLGALFLALLCYVAGVYDMNGGQLGASLAGIATSKCSLAPISALILGILCNILVCAGVYMAFSSKTTSGKLLSCIFPVTFFVASGFEHSIANLFYIPAGFLASGAFNISGMLMNILFVLIGNIIGGVIFISTAFYLANHQK